MDKEFGPNGYVLCYNAIVGGAVGEHGLSIRDLEYPIGDVTLVSIPLVVPKGFSNVALQLGWLESYFGEVITECLVSLEVVVWVSHGVVVINNCHNTPYI